MDKVSIVRVLEKPDDLEIYRAVREAVDMIGGPTAFASKGDTVLLKPNWWWTRCYLPRECRSDAYSTTDRRMVVAAAKIFQELGCKVKLGEDPECFLRVEDVMASYGAAELAEVTGAEVINMRRRGYRTIPTRGKLFTEMRVLKDALEADLIVNLPLIKTNFLTTITCCLKNMKGVLPPVEKRAFHQRGLSQGVADLTTVVCPRLNIVEGIIGSDIWDMDNGLKGLGVIIAGDNPLSTDAVVARIMDYDPVEIEHLKLAHELGVGEIDASKIQVLGATIDEVRTPFTKIPNIMTLIERNPQLRLIQGDVCSACLGAIGMAFTQIGSERFRQGPPIAIITGPGAEPLPDHLNIFVGKCAQPAYEKSGKQGLYVSDCPPTAASTRYAFQHALGELLEQKYYWDHVKLADD